MQEAMMQVSGQASLAEPLQNTNFSDKWICEGNNPFAVQNSFLEASTGYTDMFTQVYAACKGSYTTIEPTEDCDLYIYVTNYIDNISWDIENADGTYGESGSASGLNHRQIVHIGDVTAGSTITVSSSDSVSSLQLYAYAYHHDVFDIAFKTLNAQGLEITKFEDTHIEGTINAKEDGLMYTSIIYDRGWKAYVDGKKVEISSINEALIAIPVTAGVHEIELKYCPENFVLGIAITVISIGILTFLIIMDKRKKKDTNAASDSDINDNVSDNIEITKDYISETASDSTKDTSDFDEMVEMVSVVEIHDMLD